MRSYRSLAVGLTLLGVLAVSAVTAQNSETEQEQPRRPLDPDVIAVRLLLGVDDRQVQAWDGRVKLDKGEVLDVEGYRFREGDEVSGRDGWKAKSHVIRKVAAKKAAMPASAVPVTKAGGPSTSGAAIAPNGVVVSLKAPADATLTVRDRAGRRQGRARRPGRRPRPNATSTARSRPSASRRACRWSTGPTRKTSPPRRPTRRGTPGSPTSSTSRAGPRCFETFTARPKDFADLAPKDGRRPDPPAPVRRRQGRRPARRHRRGARRLAARGRRRRRRRGRRRLVREPGRQLGPLPPDLRSRHEDVVGAEAADRPARGPTPTSSSRRPPTARSGWPGRAGSDGQADILLAPVEDAGAPIRVSERPGQRVVAGARHRPERPGPRRLRQLSGGQLRRHAPHPRPPTARSARRSAVAASPKYEARPSLAVDPQGGSGSPTRSGPTTGARTPRTCSKARARPSTAPAPSGSAASTATACSTPPTRSPRRAAAAPGHEQLPAARLSTARGGSGWPSAIARK